MLKKYVILLVYLTASTLAFLSCRKEEEAEPDFAIDKPWENSQWAVNDTIPFQITLKTELFISQVKVGVVSMQQIPVTTPEVFEPMENVTVINGKHIINNTTIETGTYYFKVSITNIDNITVNRFVKIYISEMPLRSEAVYVVAKQNSQIMNIYAIDSLPVFENVLQLYTDYSGSDLNSSSGYFYICGRYTGPLAAYDTQNNHALAWKEDALVNPPFPWFEGMSFDGKYIVAGLTDNRIKGFKPDGTLVFVFQLEEYFPRVFLRHNDALQQKDYLVVGASHYLGMSHTISVHYDVSYSSMHFLVTDWEARKMFSKSNDEIYMFGNDSGQGVMKIYSIAQNNTYTLKTLPTGRLSDVIRVRPGIFLISHSQGLFMYNYSYNSLTPYGNFTGEGNLAYDQSTDKIFFAQNKSLYYFSFLNEVPEGSINFADSIMNIHILYNK